MVRDGQTTWHERGCGLASPFCLAEAAGLETLLVVMSPAVVGVFFSASGHHPPAIIQPSFPPAQPQPQDGDGMTRIEAAAWIDAHSALHTSAHELTLRSSPTATPYSSKAASPPHNAKSRTRLFSINVTLGGGGWVDPPRNGLSPWAPFSLPFGFLHVCLGHSVTIAVFVLRR